MTTRCIRLAIVAAACLAGAVQAQKVTPPPLPLGSQMARPEPGMSEPERKRAVRAHHDKTHVKKDYTRDDSVRGAQAAGNGTQAAGAGTTGMGAGGVGGAAAVQGGAGTGPAREKTDKGASSYFFGKDKKKDQK